MQNQFWNLFIKPIKFIKLGLNPFAEILKKALFRFIFFTGIRRRVSPIRIFKSIIDNQEGFLGIGGVFGSFALADKPGESYFVLYI